MYMKQNVIFFFFHSTCHFSLDVRRTNVVVVVVIVVIWH